MTDVAEKVMVKWLRRHIPDQSSPKSSTFSVIAAQIIQRAIQGLPDPGRGIVRAAGVTAAVG
jgi:hypothetical protein